MCKNETMDEVNIMFDDLSPNRRFELLQAFGITHKEDMNWDIIPIAVIPIPE